jgi:hypothetical protein
MAMVLSAHDDDEGNDDKDEWKYAAAAVAA